MSNLSNIDKISIFCTICQYFTISSIDIDSKTEHGVCRQCELDIVQPNRKEWNSGWRPSIDEIQDYREKIKKRVFPILKNIHNYF